MTITSYAVRKTARTALKKNWLNAVIACVAGLFSFILCVYAGSFFAIPAGDTAGNVLQVILAFFLLLPLFLGILRFYWRSLFGVQDNPLIIFYYFTEKRLYLRALKLWGALALRALVIGVLLFLPSWIAQLFAGSVIYDYLHLSIPLWTSNLLYVAQILRAAASVVLLFVMLRYYLSPILLIADEEMQVTEALHLSVLESKTSSLEFLALIGSFIGWGLLSILIFPLVFTLPYFLTACCVHGRFVFARYNKTVAAQTVPDEPPTYAANI